MAKQKKQRANRNNVAPNKLLCNMFNRQFANATLPYGCDKPKADACKGPQCESTDGTNHSPECVALHDEVTAECANEPASVPLAIVHAQTAVAPSSDPATIAATIDRMRAKAKTESYPFEQVEVLNGHNVHCCISMAKAVIFTVDGRKMAFDKIVSAIAG